MEFSNRLKSLPSQFFATLVKKVGAAVLEGRDVINLGQGNPDQPTPPHIIQALQQAATNPQNHKYSPFRGTGDFKQAAANFYKREYNVDIDPETEVAILFGTKIGLVELPLALLNEHDLMLLPDPGYPDYLSGVGLANVEFNTMPLLKKNNFLPDYSSLTEEQKQKAKLMYLNYPNNPTGAVANLDFFQDTVTLAKQADIAIVHDFAYGGIGFDGAKPISFLQADGAKDVGVEMYTLSKTYNMAGWRVGFAVGNAKMIEAINLIQDHLFVSIFPAVQEAATVALNDSQACVEELVDLYEGRRNTLIESCNSIGWEGNAPKGSFFAWLPVPDNFSSDDFADFLLEKADVAVAAGNGFGSYGEGYVRLGLLVDEDRLKEAIMRIGKLNLF